MEKSRKKLSPLADLAVVDLLYLCLYSSQVHSPVDTLCHKHSTRGLGYWIRNGAAEKDGYAKLLGVQPDLEDAGKTLKAR